MSTDKFDKSRRASSNVRNKTHFNSRISEVVEQIHSIRSLHILAGICQVLLGLSITAVAAMGLIAPVWLATLLSMLASITTIVGCSFIYTSVFREKPGDSLIREAIRRIMNAQN